MVRSRSKAIVLISTAVVVCAVAIALTMIARKWPFTRPQAIDRLQKVMTSTVEIKSFRPTYFPHAGYIAEDVTFRKQLVPGGPVEPFLTVNKLVIQAGYFGLFQRPHRLSLVLAEGVHMILPNIAVNLTQSSSDKSDPVIISEVRAEQAILDVSTSTHETGPLRFAIHTARFLNIGPGKTIAFSTALHIPEPPGEVETNGWIGPWRDDKGTIRSTPISGKYVLRDANLGHYESLVGTFNSEGSFKGTLAKLNAQGTATTPDFGVRESGHRFHLNTRYVGTVDMKNGDVLLSSLEASFGKTSLTATANVTGYPKTIELNVGHGRGEVQDLITMFTSSRSPITGPITFTTKTSLPPGDAPFKQRVRLAGEFNIDPAKFTAADTQADVDKLSADARGHTEPLAEDNEVVSNLQGKVNLQRGIATVTPVTFSVPGATANMAGTYNLVSQRVDFSGKMRMKAKLSEATTGAKSVFLKMLDPFFKKKGAGAELPVQMDGVYGDTHFNIGLRAKK